MSKISTGIGDNIVAILGGRGMLGTDLAKVCLEGGYKVEVFDLPEFDITNTQQLEQVVHSAGAIINCAAYTNVDKAESESELAYEVNAQAVGRMGELAERMQKWVLHISTDFVFDGTSNRPYVETDSTNPINIYGKSKLAGEQLLIQSKCSHCIIRVQWTYGRAGGNFVTKLVDRARQGGSIKVVDDQIGSPTATTEIAKVICRFLPQRPQGLFHFAASGYVSRFEMAKFVFENLDMSVDLTNCKSSDFPSAAARPLNSRFDCSKIQAQLEKPIESWRKPLKCFLEQL